MAVAFSRMVVPLVVGLAAPLSVALTWAPAGEMSGLGKFIRAFYVLFIGAELFVITVALREGLVRSARSWDWSRAAAIAAVALLAIAIGTIFAAPLRAVAVMQTGFWVVHALFALSVAHLCGRLFGPGDLVRAYLAGFAIFAVQFVLFVSLIPDWGSFNWRNQFMMFTHVRHAGYYLAAIAALAIGVMAGARGRGEWLWALAAASSAIGIAMWTGSRGAMLALAAASLAGLLFASPMRRVRGWGGGLAAGTIALALVAVAPSVQNSLVGLNRTVAATATPDVTTGRTIIWAGALEAVKDRPLFGYGEGQMRAVAPFHDMIQPHSSLLQVALAWGLAGLACVLVLAVAFAARTLPALRRDDGTLTPPFLAMAAIGSLSLYDGALYYALPISMFLACGAVIAASWPHARGREREPLAAGQPAPVGAAER